MMRVVSRPLTILPASHRKMKLVFAFLLLVTLSGAVCGQEAKQRATVEGIVTKDPDSQPVKKALIELIADNQLEAGNYTTITAADGTFRIEDILPGRYHLFAERTGLLDTDRQRRRSDGQILTLSGGQELKDLHLRLQAAAVIRGRISDEDGDPLPNAEVTALRQTYVAGHKHWEQAGADRSNDLGEYRIANLPAGNVYISVNPPPDFKSLIENAGTVADRRNPKPDRPSQTYQTIFYPGTADRGQAAPIELHAESEHSGGGGESAATSVGHDHAAVARPQLDPEWSRDAQGRHVRHSRCFSGKLHDYRHGRRYVRAHDGTPIAAAGFGER